MKSFTKLFILYFGFGVLMSNGIIRFKDLEYTAENIGNAGFLVGALFLLIGIIRYLNDNNLLSLVIYSYRKFLEIVRTKDYSKNTSKIKDYHDYLESKEEDNQPYGAIIVNGILFCSFAIMLVWKSF